MPSAQVYFWPAFGSRVVGWAPRVVGLARLIGMSIYHRRARRAETVMNTYDRRAGRAETMVNIYDRRAQRAETPKQ